MNERTNILARIREALAMPAQAPGGHSADFHNAERTGGEPTPHLRDAATEARRFRQWLPVVRESYEERLALFRQNMAALRGEYASVGGEQGLGELLRQMCEREGWKKIATHRGPLTDFACQALALPRCRTDAGYQIADLESCDVGVTECDALIAQTGSVLVTSRSAGGRALSVLPPHHVVLARPEQLLADLPAAFALLKQKYAPNYPSFISLITGPSRTGDIERVLVLGAHGPKKLSIVLVGDDVRSL